MIIIGAGLTACLAGMYNQHATIYSPDSLESLKKHKAILRFPTADIENLTGIPCKKVRITKSVFTDGHKQHADITNRNEYSYKVSGHYNSRSIENLEPVTRWIPPADFHERMLDILKHRITFEHMPVTSDAVPTITTLPIDRNVYEWICANEDFGNTVEKRSIYVTKIKIDNCNVWHTIYYPESRFPPYRASIEGDLLTIESVRRLDCTDVTIVMNSLGLYGCTSQLLEYEFEQEIGKIVPMDETIRRDTIKRLTVDHNVYSLGRWATWRSIQLQDVVKDLSVIHRLINQSDYDLMVGK